MVNETQTLKLMKTLNISRAEAIQIQIDDERIDKGENLFELDAEHEAESKKARQADRQFREGKATRSRRTDRDKKFVFNSLFKALQNIDEDATIDNQDREITVVYNNKKYKVVLQIPRN